MTSAAQRAICRRFGTVPEPPSPGSNVGLAHLGRYVPEIEPYLAPGHEDVWFDAALLDPR